MSKNGKTYHFCSHENGAPANGGCNKWVRHKPIECQGKKFQFKKEEEPMPGSKWSPKGKSRELQIKAATLGLTGMRVTDDVIRDAELRSDYEGETEAASSSSDSSDSENDE